MNIFRLSRLQALADLARALEEVWESHRLEGGTYNAPPSISAPVRANATNFGGYLGPIITFSGQNFGTVGQPLQGQKGSNFQNVDLYDR